MEMMSTSGLAEWLSNLFTKFSIHETLPLFGQSRCLPSRVSESEILWGLPLYVGIVASVFMLILYKKH
ncbi:hypothetical protein IC801_05905 [Geobacillus sp. 44B]|nr:hypothetical protein IC801_05905 [Geobacillus sp. 44B]